MKSPLTKFLILITTAVALYFATVFYLDWRIPRATVIIQVHPSILPPISPGSTGSQITQHYMESEFEAIISEPTMALTATLLGIKKDNQTESILLIKENVTVAPIRGTDFIKITAKDPDPQKAVNIANAIADAYTQRRVSSAEARAQMALSTLDEDLATQEKRLDSYRQNLTKTLETYGLEFPTDGQTFPKTTDLPLAHITGTVDLPLHFSPYNEALDHFTQSRNMLREMKIKQAEARVLLKMPHLPITIHQRAK